MRNNPVEHMRREAVNTCSVAEQQGAYGSLKAAREMLVCFATPRAAVQHQPVVRKATFVTDPPLQPCTHLTHGPALGSPNVAHAGCASSWLSSSVTDSI